MDERRDGPRWLCDDDDDTKNNPVGILQHLPGYLNTDFQLYHLQFSSVRVT